MSSYGQGRAIKSFYEVDSYTYSNQISESIKTEIQNKGKEYIIGVDEDEFKNYLEEKYTLETLEIDYDSVTIEEPTVTKEWLDDRFYGNGRYQTDVYNFTIKYKFSGSPVLFQVRPSHFTMITTDIFVNTNYSTVSFNFKLYKKDPEEFKRAKSEFEKSAFTNLDNVNSFAQSFNNGLKGIINSFFQNQKNEYLKENDFFSAINVKINKDTVSVFTAPTIKKKVIPQPSVAKNKEFSAEPMMAKEMYDDILKVIYDLGKNMEKKPSTYQNKDEEGLRDQILLVLETRYDGTTASGETFNRGGKTDIILKYANDGSNLFVAECKFWHGSAEFLKAISQLFDRYLTWRDSKTSLILFVTNKDLTNVIDTVLNDVKQHPYYVKENGKRGETSFSYLFCLPQDKEKLIYLEVILFHYDK